MTKDIHDKHTIQLSLQILDTVTKKCNQCVSVKT